MNKVIIKKGDRVEHNYLGKGIFIKRVNFLSIVKWDIIPDIKYNMRENPCTVFSKTLKKIKTYE